MCNIGFVIDLTRLTGGDWCSAADASSAAATAARYSLSSASDMERLEARLGGGAGKSRVSSKSAEDMDAR